MKFNLEQYSFLAAILGAIITGTWKLSQQKTEILNLIDDEMRLINSSLQDIRYKLGIKIAEDTYKGQLVDFRLKTLEGNLVSNFRRCQQQIKEIKSFLEKDTAYKDRDGSTIE